MAISNGDNFSYDDLVNIQLDQTRPTLCTIKNLLDDYRAVSGFEVWAYGGGSDMFGGFYAYSDAYDQIDSRLDWVDGSGYAPVGIDYNIQQATQVQCYYNATLYIIKGATSTFSTIKDRVDINVEQYVENLQPGENVIYSEIYYQIMRDPDVWRVDDLRIYESGGSFLQEDIHIDDGEVAVFEGSTVNEG